MTPRNYGKLLAAAGALCFAIAFALLTTFKGQFGKDTVGVATVQMNMEETLDLSPPRRLEEKSEPEQLKAVAGALDSPMWVVYVTGAVKRPGVYKLSPGARVYEALNAAGGFSSDADQEAVNLAAKLEDGVHVKFARKGESSQSQVYGEGSTPIGSYQAANTSAKAGKININSATLEELQAIVGVGPKTAQAIINYRNENGNFTRIEDIVNVRGIGPKKFQTMKDSITVDR